jgi:hypothetical protein
MHKPGALGLCIFFSPLLRVTLVCCVTDKDMIPTERTSENTIGKWK